MAVPLKTISGANSLVNHKPCLLSTNHPQYLPLPGRLPVYILVCFLVKLTKPRSRLVLHISSYLFRPLHSEDWALSLRVRYYVCVGELLHVVAELTRWRTCNHSLVCSSCYVSNKSLIVVSSALPHNLNSAYLSSMLPSCRFLDPEPWPSRLGSIMMLNYIMHRGQNTGFC